MKTKQPGRALEVDGHVLAAHGGLGRDDARLAHHPHGGAARDLGDRGVVDHRGVPGLDLDLGAAAGAPRPRPTRCA